MNANCTNTYGSYKCTCKAGYNGDRHSCSGTLNFHHQRWPWICFSIDCFSSPLCEVSSWLRVQQWSRIYSNDVIDKCSITVGLCQTLVSEAKGNKSNTMLCRYFWLSDRNKINQNKSSLTSLTTNHHHQPKSSSWPSLCSSSLRTLLLIDVDECSDKIHVCDVNAKCTDTNGSHNCTCTDGHIGDGQSCHGTCNDFWH